MDDEHESTVLHLNTYSALWQIERRLYRFYEWDLPAPVTLRQVGTAGLAYGLWFALLMILHVPFAINGLMLVVWVAPPFAIAYMANRPIAEGKKLGQLLYSQLTYLSQPHQWAKLAPWRQPARLRVYAHTWQPRNPPQEG